MRMRLRQGTALALLATLSLPGAPALAQSPNRPQADSRTGMSPQMAVDTVQDYAKLLQSTQDQLRAALTRSGDEPANNAQQAVTPA
jgi:hypothetical protein